MKLMKSIFLLMLCGALLSGCWDRNEINDVAFVLGAAIDREKDGYRVSVVIPLPGNLSGPTGGGGGGNKKPYTIQSEVGTTTHEAIDKLQLQLSRKLFFAHSRLILIGEDVLQEGIDPIMDTALRLAEIRLTTLIAATKGNAADFLGADVKLERFPIEAMREILESDDSIRVSLKQLALDMNTTGSEAVIPYFEVVKAEVANEKTEEIRATGYALLKKGKKAAVIHDDEADGIRLLKGAFKPFSQTLTTDNGAFTVLFSSVDKEIKPYLVGTQIHFNIKIYAVGNITEDLSTQDIFNHIPVIQTATNQRLELQVKQLMRTLTNVKSDAVGFGHILSRKYPGKWESIWEPNWDYVFSQCQFHVTVETKVFGFGMLRRNMTVREE